MPSAPRGRGDLEPRAPPSSGAISSDPPDLLHEAGEHPADPSRPAAAEAAR